MASKSLDTLQAGRALSCLAVLLFHANVTLALPKYLGREVAPLFRAGGAGVQYFFVLSGFVILLAHQRDIGRPEMLSRFLWKRFRRVYPPLWCVLVVILITLALVPTFLPDDSRNPATIVSAFLLTPTASDRILTPEWTLRHEALFYAVFALAIWRRSLGFAVGGLWLILSLILPFFHLPFLFSFLFTTNHALFGLGMLACLMLERRTPRRGTAWLLFLAGMMLFAALWTIQVREALDANELTNIIFGLGATFMILGLAALEHGAGLVVSPALVFVGEASYSIYLVHYPVISIATKAIMAVRDRMPAPDWLLYLCVAASALGLGILFHVCVERQILARLRTNPSVRTLSPALPHSPAGRAHSYSAGRGAR